MNSQPVPFPLRIPDELRQALAERARANNRSLNAEILDLLQKSVDDRVLEGGSIDVELLANRIVDSLVIRLESKPRDQERKS